MKKLLSILMLLVAIVTGAQAADEILYSMTNPTAPTGNLASKTGSNVTATLSGGTAYVYNGKGSAAALVSSNKQINLAGSGNSYFKATITTEGKKIAVGDIIKIANSDINVCISGTSTKPSKTTLTNGEYVVQEGSNLVDATTVYIWKGDNSTFSFLTITRLDPSSVATPAISFSENKATIACATTGATIYYTLDGTEPTTSSTLYPNSAVTLTNTCTVRAKAFKGDYSSEIAKKDCYVNNSAVANYLATLNYNGGTVDGDVWTGANGYTLTNNTEGRGIGYTNLAGSQDGFKLNHVDNYTIQAPVNVKVTKIVVAGKSWLEGSAGNASTIAFDGFTPASGSFYDYPTGGETYVKAIEFTPTSELAYGASITMRPGNNQLGAYIEIYGEELPPIVTLPTDTKEGYNYSGATTTEVSRDGNPLKGKTVLAISNGGTATITVPATTNVSMIKVWGTSSDGSTSNITIGGFDAEKSATVTFVNRDATTTSSVIFVPTTQTTSYTVTSTNKGSWVFVEVYGEEPASQDITVGATGFATIGLPFATTVPEGVTAYAVTSVSDAGKVTMSAAITEGTTIPANQGFVIVAAPEETYTFTETASATYDGTNLLEATGATEKAASTDAPIYVLAQISESKVGFKKATSGSLAAYKAYLPGNVSTLTSLSISLEDDATAINGIAEAEANAEVPVKVIKNGKLYIGNYNVAGQQVK